VEESKGV
jgi:tetratricopeptide (TPR) repeat protein